MAKIYSPEHVAKIYNVDPVIVNQWMNGNTAFAAAMNSEFAKFLGLTPKSLKGTKKVSKKKKKALNQEYRQQQKLKAKLAQTEKDAFWNENYQKIRNYKFRESADLQVEKLLTLAGNDDQLKNKINEIYFTLPPAYKYIETNCSKKYFTWSDLSFVENGVKVNPNVCFLFIPIDGPTSILQNVNVDYFQKKYKKELYKIYINNESGKTEFLLSEDINKIKNIVENHIHKKKPVNKSSPVKTVVNTASLPLQFSEDQRSISFQEILKAYPHNEYIQMAAKLLRKNGKALALWENNNGIQEESLLIILEHKNSSFIIWENINDKRACYIFKFKSWRLEQNLKNLKIFIAKEIHYKRENLFRRADINEFNILVEEYRPIIHENPRTYQESLNKFISPYFKI